MNRDLADAFGILLGLMFATLALFLLGFAGWLGAENLHVLAAFRRAEGEVINIHMSRSPGARFTVRRIEVLYRACPEPTALPPKTPLPFELPPPMPRLASEPEGECVPGERGRRRTSSDAFGPTTLTPGDAVTVYWHPAHPHEVRVGAFSTFWFMPFILSVIALPFAWYGSLIWRDLRREWRQRQRGG